MLAGSRVSFPATLAARLAMERTERFYRIQQLLHDRRVVPFSVFLEKLEVSRATVKRDLEYLRNRMNAPIAWDREARGYRLTAPEAGGGQYELPGLWFNASEIHALLTMQHLLAHIEPGILAPQLEPIAVRLRVLLGSVSAGAMGLLVLILSDGQADALWACAMLIGAAACFLGVSRRGMLLCSLMGMLVAQGAAGVSGVLRADVQPWTDAALLCASVSTALAEIVRRTAIFLLTPPGVKGGHRG